ncbi:MAG: VTT domain-containing protein [Candidatus Paceibacterota bacterium]|jgi:membrane-associated protein
MPPFLDPQVLIQAAGLAGILAIVFSESGLFFGFFLPGDSLLFTAGLFASQGHLNIFALTLGCVIAAIAGDSVGYMFGRRVGPVLFSREDSFFFHKRHIDQAGAFYAKYGAKTIVLARFVPIVRTFAPIVAGVGKMEYKTFIAYNVIGGTLWAGLMTVAGFSVGSLVPNAQKYLHLIVIGIIALSLVPIIFEWFRAKGHRAEPEL